MLGWRREHAAALLPKALADVITTARCTFAALLQRFEVDLHNPARANSLEHTIFDRCQVIGRLNALANAVERPLIAFDTWHPNVDTSCTVAEATCACGHTSNAVSNVALRHISRGLGHTFAKHAAALGDTLLEHRDLAVEVIADTRLSICATLPAIVGFGSHAFL